MDLFTRTECPRQMNHASAGARQVSLFKVIKWDFCLSVNILGIWLAWVSLWDANQLSEIKWGIRNQKAEQDVKTPLKYCHSMRSCSKELLFGTSLKIIMLSGCGDHLIKFSSFTEKQTESERVWVTVLSRGDSGIRKQLACSPLDYLSFIRQSSVWR